MSFFSKKSIDYQASLAHTNVVIKTMQDDLDAINIDPYQEDSSKEESSHTSAPVIRESISIQESSNKNASPSPFSEPAPIEAKTPQVTLPPKPVAPKPIDPLPIAPITPAAPKITEAAPSIKKPSLSEQAPKPLPTPTPETNTPAAISLNPNFNQNPFAVLKETEPAVYEQSVPSSYEEEFANEDQSESSSVKILLFILFIIIVSGGGVYYYITKKSPTSLIQEINPPPQNQQNPSEPQPVFSTDKPNYLPIDTVSSTPQSIQGIFSKTAQQVMSLNSDKPVEFFVTDSSNTPLSFATFAKLTGISLSESTLQSLGEKFSLFIYTSNQTSHLGLSIEIKDKTALASSLRQEEPTLAKTFSPLFLGDSASNGPHPFNDGVYKGILLRYNNIHPETMLSIDYAIRNQHLVIGTSMKTHHALLDIVQ